MPDQYNRIPEHTPDMGDDEQETQTDLLREYEEDPPSDLVISSDDTGEMGISRWVAQESRWNEEEEDERSAEEAALHVELRERRAPEEEES